MADRNRVRVRHSSLRSRKKKYDFFNLEKYILSLSLSVITDSDYRYIDKTTYNIYIGNRLYKKSKNLIFYNVEYRTSRYEACAENATPVATYGALNNVSLFNHKIYSEWNNLLTIGPLENYYHELLNKVLQL